VRILVASEAWFPDSLGGVSRVANATARSLARRGHSITVITRKPPIRLSGKPEEEFRLLRRLPNTILPVTATDIPFTALAARRAGGPWDVVMAHGSTTSVGLSLARLGAPMVRVFHASAVRELRLQRRHATALRERGRMYALEPLLAAADSLSLRSATRILVLSEFTRSILANHYSYALPRTVCVSGGVDTDTFSPADGQAHA
jgi:glycosyltransferase involved in cell wall biosynthesis